MPEILGVSSSETTAVRVPSVRFSVLMEGGVIVEENEPKAFFEHPQQERTKAFLRLLGDDGTPSHTLPET